MCRLSVQDGELELIENVVIAEGTDSPLKDIQLVCFNKYFKLDYFSYKFRK